MEEFEESMSSLETDDFSMRGLEPLPSSREEGFSARPSSTRKGIMGFTKNFFSNLAPEADPKSWAEMSEMSGFSLGSINFSDDDLKMILPIPGRESHTADLEQFDKYLEQLRDVERIEEATPFNDGFWDCIRAFLEVAKPLGYTELDEKDAVLPRGAEDNDALLLKVYGTELVNPIHPILVAERAGFPIDEVITELLYATQVGLLRMHWAPACTRCDATSCADAKAGIGGRVFCEMCRYENTVDALTKMKVFFTLDSDVFFVLAENFLSPPSKESMAANELYALVPATFTGSGFRFSLGCGGDLMLRSALPAGRYRMHCPVSNTDNYLVVERNVTESDVPITFKLHVSDIRRKPGRPIKTITVKHGMVHFDVFTDTRSFFVLWIQQDLDEEKLFSVPPEERKAFTDALQVMQHPTYRALYADNLNGNLYEALELMKQNSS